ncbi:TatD family hydrolase [Streptomyces sp. RY43-2]|uniref:TatD family hydrolase n=1 Tax=Streptomyces macrolidinus TaxID=2952607 RepID=A0ABT0ZM15_9ACTN|nr:TatD family hydrolase [Streptomyces macrolidinus]MCN9244621.1 TatD family hydrolase [Streptomyces macrolidinus]
MPQLPPDEAIGCPPVRVFDHHIHADGRNADDYELMALSGVDTVLIPCSASNETRPCGASYEARFERLLTTETRRAAHYGVRVWLGLSVHAADMADLASAMDGVDRLAARLDDPRVLALGELSIRRFSEAELTVFAKQLELATALGKPVMVELPPGMPEFHRMMEVLRQAIDDGLVDPARVALMDVAPPMLPVAAGLGCGGLGIAVSPASDRLFQVRLKTDHHQLLSLLDEFGPDRLMLNSGFHFGSADPLGLAKTVLRLRLAGVDPGLLDRVARENAAEFFRLPTAPTAATAPTAPTAATESAEPSFATARQE